MARRNASHEKVTELRGGFKALKLKSGRDITFRDARSGADAALSSLYTWTSRMGKLARDYTDARGWFGDDLSEYDFDWEEIEGVVDLVEEYVGVWRHQIREHNKRRNKQLQIIALRNVIGRGPEEAAAYLAKADQLERELEAKQSTSLWQRIGRSFS